MRSVTERYRLVKKVAVGCERLLCACRPFSLRSNDGAKLTTSSVATVQMNRFGLEMGVCYVMDLRALLSVIDFRK